MYIKLFRTKSSNPKIDVQNNLEGLTNYVDPDTMKFFKARIIDCKITSCGQYLILVESLPLGSFDAERKKRAVVFNILGHVLHKTEGGHNAQQQIKHAYDFINDHEAQYWVEVENSIKATFESNILTIGKLKNALLQ
jgi:hypothetical protein